MEIEEKYGRDQGAVSDPDEIEIAAAALERCAPEIADLVEMLDCEQSPASVEDVRLILRRFVVLIALGTRHLSWPECDRVADDIAALLEKLGYVDGESGAAAELEYYPEADDDDDA